MKEQKIRFTPIPSTAEVEAERERLAYRSRYMRVLRSTVYTLLVVAAVAVLLAPLFLPALRRRRRGKPPCRQPAVDRKSVSSRFPSPCAAKGRTDQKCQNIHRHDGRTHRRPCENGDQNPQRRAAY